MPLIGTAGHVDHGKSTLIAALTGRDPDRWKEEKDRGLTIDLGFAWATIGEYDVSFVDVPGHERFLKNMLAGVDPIDVALFVVAADEGWAPQSEEHLAVLDLLGIDRAVVALTKVDRVDDDLIELAMLEVEEHLIGSSLANAPIVPVSAATGEGIALLRDRLAETLTTAAERRDGPPTLWIDRAFSVAGAGTVVTGSLSGGPIAVGDTLTLLPTGLESRVRSIQSHEQDREVVEPGRRVALGVPEVPKEAAVRGTVLATSNTRVLSTTLLASVRPARGFDSSHLERGAFHLHLGTGDWPVQVRPISEDTVIIRTQEPIAVTALDRFVLRDAGRRAVVGGGRVLDPAADPRTRRAREAAPRLLAAGEDRSLLADVFVSLRGILTLDEASSLSGGGVPGDSVRVGSFAVDAARIAALVIEAERVTADHHRSFPLRDGFPKAELGSRLGIPTEVLEAVVERSGQLVIDGAVIAHLEHRPRLSTEQEATWATIKADLMTADLAPPRGEGVIPDGELRHLLRRLGLVIPVGEFLYLPEVLDSVRGRLSDLDQPFTAAEAKEHLGISRKHAIPLLEWCDANGVTRRSGSERQLRGD